MIPTPYQDEGTSSREPETGVGREGFVANSGIDSSARPGKHQGAVATEQAAPVLTAGPAFESQAKTLLGGGNRSESERYGLHSGQIADSEIEDSPGRGMIPWRHIQDLTEGFSTFTIPAEQESQHLLQLFLLYLGANQHFFEQRAFTDNMKMLYKSSLSRKRQQSSMWFAQYLLVMAMGRLMDSATDDSERPPGASLFAEALRRLPPTHDLGEHGPLGVEILATVGLYLQWCDKRHDAYLYVEFPPLHIMGKG